MIDIEHLSTSIHLLTRLPWRDDSVINRHETCPSTRKYLHKRRSIFPGLSSNRRNKITMKHFAVVHLTRFYAAQ